ncbi:MAG: transposase [Planctomycetes bacterium]|nr:transposase [Planctomycetota bacterium]
MPIDHNEVERAIRTIAIGRKNWLFAGSLRGGRCLRTRACSALLQAAGLRHVGRSRTMRGAGRAPGHAVRAHRASARAHSNPRTTARCQPPVPPRRPAYAPARRPGPAHSARPGPAAPPPPPARRPRWRPGSRTTCSRPVPATAAPSPAGRARGSRASRRRGRSPASGRRRPATRGCRRRGRAARRCRCSRCRRWPRWRRMARVRAAGGCRRPRWRLSRCRRGTRHPLRSRRCAGPRRPPDGRSRTARSRHRRRGDGQGRSSTRSTIPRARRRWAGWRVRCKTSWAAHRAAPRHRLRSGRHCRRRPPAGDRRHRGPEPSGWAMGCCRSAATAASP